MMTQFTPKQPPRRGRIFPELTLSPAELAKRKAEDEAFRSSKGFPQGRARREERIENSLVWVDG